MFSKQKGFSILGFVFIASLLGSYIVLALKLVPVYYEHRLIKQTTSKLIKAKNASFMTKHQIINALEKKLYVESVALPPVRDFKFTRKDGVVTFVIDYTKAVPVFANVSASIHFKDEFKY